MSPPYMADDLYVDARSAFAHTKSLQSYKKLFEFANICVEKFCFFIYVLKI